MRALAPVCNDEVWAHVEPWIPAVRSRRAARQALEGMIFQMRTRCAWDALPEVFGDGQRLAALRDAWAEAGVFHILYFALVHVSGGDPAVDLSWCRPPGVAPTSASASPSARAETAALRPGQAFADAGAMIH